MLEIGEGKKLLLYTQSPAKTTSKEGSFLPPLLEENGKFLPRFLDKQSYNTSKKTILFLMC